MSEYYFYVPFMFKTHDGELSAASTVIKAKQPWIPLVGATNKIEKMRNYRSVVILNIIPINKDQYEEAESDIAKLFG